MDLFHQKKNISNWKFSDSIKLFDIVILILHIT